MPSAPASMRLGLALAMAGIVGLSLWRTGGEVPVGELEAFNPLVRIAEVNVPPSEEDVSSGRLPRVAAQERTVKEPGSRVICTMLKNEAPHVAEWINFHRSYGWNKFVIYDDHSTDRAELLRELARFPKNEVEHIIVPDDVAPRPELHSHCDVQIKWWNDCIARYWNVSEIMATIDVDEFIYPCPGSWDSPRLFENMLSGIVGEIPKGKPLGYFMECYKFGFDGAAKFTRGQSTLQSQVRRAAYDEDGLPLNQKEFREAIHAVTRDVDGYLGEVYGSPKHVYVRNGWKPFTLYLPGGFNNTVKLPLRVSLHEFVGFGIMEYAKNHTSRNRFSSALCCDHHPYRSFETLLTKVEKNRDMSEYGRKFVRMCGIDCRLWKLFTRVRDTAARDFYQALKEQGWYAEV